MKKLTNIKHAQKTRTTNKKKLVNKNNKWTSKREKIWNEQTVNKNTYSYTHKLIYIHANLHPSFLYTKNNCSYTKIFMEYDETSYSTLHYTTN